LADNAALSAAVATGRPVIPLYILDEKTPGRWAPGGASRWWLHHSLKALAQTLEAAGGRLVLRRGVAPELLPALVDQTGATAIYFTRCYEPYAADLERKLESLLRGKSVGCRRFGGNLLFEPESAATKTGQPYRVFTPFYKACLNLPRPKAPLAAPTRLAMPPAMPQSDRLEEWRLLPDRPDWAGGLRESWKPGEVGAGLRLENFLENTIAGYNDLRDRPDRPGTSRLSPHLRFGEISPRQCWYLVSTFMDSRGAQGDGGAHAFLRELIWREFSYHLLHHWPSLPASPFRAEFTDFAWTEDRSTLAAWQKGLTGYPIVDAGLRELWHSGWMHNRVRMIVASFLVKDLLIPWQDGAAWFWDTLVDADLANNSASWQWVAGCGADAAPYFRVFNPVLQGRKFDPDGAYVRRWIPELAELSNASIHEPWQAGDDSLRQCGVVLGKTYPRPVVDHATARKRALAALEDLKRRRTDRPL